MSYFLDCCNQTNEFYSIYELPDNKEPILHFEHNSSIEQ